MLGRSIPELILVRFSILILHHSLALWPALFLLTRVVVPSHTIISTIFLLLTTVEIGFYALVFRPHVSRRLSASAQHPPPLTREQRIALFYRVLADVEDPEAYLRGWFLGSPIQDIKHDNVADFLAWAFFDCHVHDVPLSDRHDLEMMLAHVSALFPHPLPAGRGPATPLRLTLDPVQALYRSVLWYGLLTAVDLFTHAVMVWRGFEYHAQPGAGGVFPPRPQLWWARKRSVAPGMAYWYRGAPSSAPPNSTPASSTPIVLLHGIGVGLVSYLGLLSALPPTPIIAIEVLPISCRLCAPPLTRPEFLSSLTAIIDAHHPSDPICLVGHSYGTVLSAHVIHSPLRSRLASVVLVDPVSIRLHLPDVAVNFTRRLPRTANEWQLWFFASTDPGVAECLGRWFFWRDNVLWREDVVGLLRQGARVAVFLGGRDLIVDAWGVFRHMQPLGVDLDMFEELDHSQVLEGEGGKAVARRIGEYVGVGA